jgi:hypothetical protein
MAQNNQKTTGNDFKIEQRAYQRAESEFFFRFLDERTDLREFAMDHGFVPRRGDEGKTSGDYYREDTKIHIKKGNQHWVWCYPGQKNVNGEKTIHLNFLIQFGGASDNKAAFDKLREYFKSKFFNEYENFIESYRKANPGKYCPNINFISGVPNSIKRNQIAKAEEQPKNAIREFTLKPAEDFSFILDRGITKETIDHPLFRGRFGNSNGVFGDDNTENKATDSSLQYQNHLIVPLTDYEGTIVGLEAKNRFTEETFEKMVSRQYDSDNDLRRNPSKVYVASNRKIGYWRSNIPENPTRIFMCEQPMDALAYFQIHREDPDIERTIFITTGGVPTEEQLKAVWGYCNKYNIKKILLGYDNDQHGLKYSVSVISSGTEKANVPFTIDMVSRSSDELQYIVFHSGGNKGESLSVSQLQSMIERELGQHQVDGDFIPSMVVGEKILPGTNLGSVSFAYSEKNARGIINLTKQITGNLELFQFELPALSKDWNDVLQNKPYERGAPGKYLLDVEENRNKLLIDSRGSLTLLRRFISPELQFKEVVGNFNPFAIKEFFKPSKDINLNMGLGRELELLNRDYAREVGALTEDFYNRFLTQGIQYKDGQFIKEGNPLSENYPFTPSEKLALEWMSAAKANNVPVKPLLTIHHREIYYGRQSNGNVYYENNKVFRKVEVARMGPTQKWDKIDAEYPIPANILELLKDLAGLDFQKLAAAGVIVDQGQIFIKYTIAEISTKGEIIFNNPANRDEDVKILGRMLDLLSKGLDPNNPGFIGRINTKLEIEFVKNFERRLTPAGKSQLALLQAALESKRIKMGNFLENFQEPFIRLTSKDMVLYEDLGALKPIVQFDHKTENLKWLCNETELETRSFNTPFFKSVMLFQENKGIFHNYIKSIKVQENKIYYRSPNAVVGEVIKVGGKERLLITDGVPKTMARELEVFSPYQIISKEEVGRLGLQLDHTVRLKEKKTTAIPQEYTPFFDRLGKMVFMSNEELEKLKVKNPKKYERYIEAECWSLNQSLTNQNETGPIKPSSKVLVDHNGILKLGRVTVAKYDPEKDRVDLLTNPAHKFFPQIGLFERSYVKDPVNRKFAHHVYEESIEKNQVSNSEILQQLSETSFTGNEKEGWVIHILHKNGNYFDKAKVGQIKGNQLLAEKDILSFSPLLESALKYLADEKKLVFVETEFKQAPGPQLTVKPEIQISKETNVHELTLTKGDFLKGITSFPSLRGIVSIDIGGHLQVVSAEGVKFSPEKGSENLSLVGPIPVDRKYLIVAEKPEHLVNWAQSNFHIAMHDQVYLVSLQGESHATQRQEIDSIVRGSSYQRMTILGSESFLKEVGEPLRQTGVPVELSAPILGEESLLNIKTVLAQHHPDHKLENIIQKSENIVFSPTKGIAIVPMVSSVSKSYSIIAQTDKPSADANSIWISGNSRSESLNRIVLMPSIREGLAYLALNKGFTEQQLVISFNQKPNTESINYISTLLKSRLDLVDKIYVGNTNKFAENLEQEKFPFRIKICIPQYGASTFEQECDIIEKNMSEAKKELSLQKVKEKSFSVEAELKHEALAVIASPQGPRSGGIERSYE